LLAPRLKATTKPGRKVEAEVWLRERALLGDAENIEVLSTAERLTHTIDEVKTILSDVIP
jgi:hypothetical protein